MKKSYINNLFTLTDFDEDELIYSQINKISPQKLWQAYINEKKVLINDRPLVKNQYVSKDTILNVSLPIESIDYALDEDSVDIVYEDEVLLIVNKPKDIIIYDINKDAKHTLCSHVAKYYYDTKQSHGIHYIHRLDKDTTGCCIFVKHRFFQSNLDTQLAKGILKRNYIALASGIISKDLTINQPIGRDRHDKKLRRIDPNGQTAITHIKVLGYIGNNTLIQCELETGRTHQIRVHLQSIGHALVGDPWYGTPTKKGLCLHSYQVQLFHPVTDEKVLISCKDIPFLSKEEIDAYCV